VLVLVLVLVLEEFSSRTRTTTIGRIGCGQRLPGGLPGEDIEAKAWVTQ
jgi:hypothetical protein